MQSFAKKTTAESMGTSSPHEVSLPQLEADILGVVQSLQAGTVQYLTDRGKTIGVILPLGSESDREVEDEAAWTRLEELGREIDSSRKSPKTSLQILSEMRR